MHDADYHVADTHRHASCLGYDMFLLIALTALPGRQLAYLAIACAQLQVTQAAKSVIHEHAGEDKSKSSTIPQSDSASSHQHSVRLLYRVTLECHQHHPQSVSGQGVLTSSYSTTLQ